MRAIVCDRMRPSGAAVIDLPDPPGPGPGEVLVRMRFAPVNPADRLVIAGSYAPPGGLPEVIGAEGMGVVEAVGRAGSTVVAGTRVILLSSGYWAGGRGRSAAQLPGPATHF